MLDFNRIEVKKFTPFTNPEAVDNIAAPIRPDFIVMKI